MAYHKDALPRGEQLGDYVIESVLGHGGFGITYLARDTNLGSDIALKEYLPQAIASREEGDTRIIPNNNVPNAIKDYHWGLTEFLKEAQALARFKHANIVRVLRFLEANGTAYMAMEYQKGQSLSRILKDAKNHRLDEKDVLKVFLPVLNGLAAVHEVGLLHLDIKPDNIYIREDGTPMLIDFGSARQAIIETDHAQKITLTHGFAPIEQYPNKGQQGPWTDLYAIGASMYFCVCGKRPPVSIDRYQMLRKHHTDTLEPATRAAAGQYPRYLLECIDWALEIHSQDRPKTAKELQDGLLGAGRPSTAQKVVINVPKKRESHYNRGPWVRRVLIGLAALAIVIGGSYAAWPQLKRQWPGPAATVEGYAKQAQRTWRRYLRKLRTS